ncbi:MAG: c-type cytochrome [Planctomycetaceae bacterium]|nr:c-type cytochrome [Planctomycetaceae bacterium]
MRTSWAGIVSCLVLLNIGVVVAGDTNSLLDISRDGMLLACANRDSGTVTIVELGTHIKRAEIAVGKHPEGVSFLGDSHRLAVAVYDDDRVVLLDADTGAITERIDVFDEPYGVVSNRDGTRLYVTLDYPGQVVEIDPAVGSIARTIESGDFARGIALSPDQSRLFVTQYYSGAVLAIDLASAKVVDQWPGISNDNLVRQIAIHRQRDKAYIPHIRSRVTAVHGEGSIFPYVSVIDTAAGEGSRRKRIPMDAFLGNLVTSNPWEAAISPDGRQFYVVLAGTDDMFACDVVDDDYREIAYRKLVKLGKNPRAVRVAPDNQTLYVYNALDFSVVAYDTQSLSTKATIAVTANPLGEEKLRGKILFYSAQQPIVGRRWISCASCHPDGQQDGRTWHNPEGLRNTQWLAGLAWTHPIHWSADRDEVQDFEHTIRGPLMQGRGLIRGEVQKELGPPNKGLSADLDAVAAYTNSHELPQSPHAKAGLSAAAQRGKTLFFSTQTKCATCHAPPLFTDSAVKTMLMHDVGTGDDDPGEKLGPKYDTPTLLGVYRTAPYLHHGQAATLKEVLVNNSGDRHGTTSHLSAAQIDDLVEFLKSLPYEDAESAASAAGLTKIDR